MRAVGALIRLIFVAVLAFLIWLSTEVGTHLIVNPIAEYIANRISLPIPPVQTIVNKLSLLIPVLAAIATLYLYHLFQRTFYDPAPLPIRAKEQRSTLKSAGDLLIGVVLVVFLLGFVVSTIISGFRSVQLPNDNEISSGTQSLLDKSNARIAELQTQIDAANRTIATTQQERDVARQQLQTLPRTPPIQNPLVEAYIHLTASDKVRLGDALFEFSQVLDRANVLFGKANILSADIQRAMKDGSIGRDVDAYRDRLKSLIDLSKTFQAALSQVREKWRYYETQERYVLFEDSGNNSTLIADGAAALLDELNDWSKVINKNDIVVIQLLDEPHRVFQESIGNFHTWWRDCSNRLSYLRANLQ